MSTEGQGEEEKEMREYYVQPEDKATITSILGTVFPAEMEKETVASPATLDEKGFEPLVEEGELPSIPTEEELVKYPELEYSGREVQAIVNKMDKAQRWEFCEYEQYFLTRYRQTGNMRPLHVEVRSIVREMCPSMPGQMQDAIVEARAQLLAEVKLKELCKQLGVPVPRYEPPPIVHPIDKGILGEKAAPMTGKESHKEPVKEGQPSTSEAVRKIVPTLVTTEVKREVKPQLQLGLLSDTILNAMGPGDEDCMVTRIKRGQDPFYNLTQDDEELKEAFAGVGEGDIPEEELDVDNLLVTSLETIVKIKNERQVGCLLPMQILK